MRERELFLQVLSIHDSVERAAFLDQACADESDLRQQVEQLLKAHDQAGEFLDPPHAAMQVDSTAAYSSQSETPGILIAGKYKLLQKIGEGGMGSVWMADQLEPVKRRIALKLIRTERDGSRTILSRFEAERQAIALMDHPNIAKLLDAGTTDGESAGRPFFVMELVKGMPLTEFCDEHKLSVPDRLQLFLQICSAVQHAHQKGIIHRDLKPTNILVEMHDNKPVPKVIDFGLAKAMSGQPLTENTLFTGFGTVAGTPLYMAPEQAKFNATDVDTRADIYALGVILYELLTGSTPIERATLKKAALDEILRVIRESEPQTPSKRISSTESQPSVATNRQTEPAKLGRFVRGDLDWIVMKSLAKERDRRYETASGFAKDIERFLNHEPVQAGPPTMRYKLSKFISRNKIQAIASLLVLLALLVGIVGTTFGLIRAEIRRVEAEQARANESKQRKIAVAEKKRAVEAEAQMLADYRAATDDAIEQLIGSKPKLGDKERTYLTNTLTRWKAFAKRQNNDERGRAIQAEGHSRVGDLCLKLGQQADARREYATARVLLEEMVTKYPAVPEYQLNLAAIHINLGSVFVGLGKHSAAREELEAAIDLYKQLVAQFRAISEHRRNLSAAHNNLGLLLAELGQSDAARAEYEQARKLNQKLVEEESSVPINRKGLAQTHINLGNLLASLGESGKAQEEYECAVNLLRVLVDENSKMAEYQLLLASTHNCLGFLFEQQRQYDKACLELEQASNSLQKLFSEYPTVPEYQRHLAMSLNGLGSVRIGLGNYVAAETEFEQARQLLETLKDEYPSEPAYRGQLANAYNGSGLVLAGLGQHSAARTEYERAIKVLEDLTEKYPNLQEYQVALGICYCNLGSLVLNGGEPATDSLTWYDKSLATLEPINRAEPRDVTAKLWVCNSHMGRAMAYDLLKKHAVALEDWNQAVEFGSAAEQTDLRALRAYSRVRGGQVAEAIVEVAELINSSSTTADQWYNFACIYSIASSKIDDKKKEYGDRAIELLKKAVEAGWKDAAHIEQDTDLGPLRDRDDFKNLLAELSRKAES